MTKPNERVGLDITSVKVPNNIMATVTEPHWRIIVDEKTGMKFSDFYKTKNQIGEPTAERFYSWKANGIPVTYLRMDNAGENKALQARVNSVDWKLNIKVEYTAPNTPQENSLAESGFRTLYCNGRAMAFAAHLPVKL